MANLAGKVAIVTGASRGIGKAIATRLAEDGATVAVTATTLEGAKRTADELEAKGLNALPLQVDVADADSVSNMVAAVLEKFGQVDILVKD